jgi:aminoglycoside phosphotransferase (APT) family kinase protein
VDQQQRHAARTPAADGQPVAVTNGDKDWRDRHDRSSHPALTGPGRSRSCTVGDMQTGDLLGSGRSADVYAIDGDDAWALRRYRDGQTTDTEAAVMTRLFAHGYPVPEVRPADPEAPHDLILRRLSGPTMVEAALTGAIGVEESGALLAELLIRLHAVPVPGAPDRSILHLDFHPLNVMLTPDGPVVIDWSNAAEGHPALDWGLSALILAQVAVATHELAPLADALLTAFLAHSPAGIALDAARMAEARALRAEDQYQSSDELWQLDEAVALVIERAAEPRTR